MLVIGKYSQYWKIASKKKITHYTIPHDALKHLGVNALGYFLLRV